MNVTSDIWDGTSARFDQNGYYATRKFLVDGVTGTAAQITFQALTAPGIPRHGDAHPGIPNVLCSDAQVTMLSNTQAHVVANYGMLQTTLLPPGQIEKGQITVGSSVQQTQTSFDSTGALIQVTYQKPHLDSKGNPTGATEPKPQTGTVTISTPSTTLKFSRRESFNPLNAAYANVGKINSDSSFGTPGTWLCTRIEGTSDDGGVTYKTDYEFQLNQNGWAAQVVYIDPATNAPPPDVQGSGGAIATPVTILGNGAATFSVYKTSDFSSLGLL